MPSCAIIGANGFLGTALISKVQKSGYEAIAVYRNSYSNIPADVEKITNEDFLAMDRKYDYIILSLGNYASSHKDLIGINSIIQEILDNNESSKVIFISSTNVYGIHDDKIGINSSFNAPSLYPMSKLAGEFMVSAHDRFAILRFTYLYGEGLNNKSFLPNMIEKSETTHEITLFGDGSRQQDYLHIDDATELCIKAMECFENGIYIGASGVSTANRIVAEVISEEHGSTISYEGEESGSSFSFDIQHTTEILNWHPKVNIIDGIRSMIKS